MEDSNAESGSRDNAVWLSHMKCTVVPLQCAASNPPKSLYSLHRKDNACFSYLETLEQTVSKSIEVTVRKKQNLFAGFVTHMEDTRLSECVLFGELVGGAVPAVGNSQGLLYNLG